MKKFIFLFSALFASLLLTPVYSVQAVSPASHILISEVQPSAGSTWGEFVELFNPTNSPIDITGWSLKKKTSAGVEMDYVASFPAVTIPARGFYLVTYRRDYVRGVYRDLNTLRLYASSLQDDNTILLYDEGGLLTDKVGWGSAVDFEGSVFPTNPLFSSTRTSFFQSIERFPVEEDGDNNASDFRLTNNPTPQNSSSTNIAPVLTEEIPVPSVTNDNTPDYTFSSTKIGYITFLGDCSGSRSYAIGFRPHYWTTPAPIDITFNPLADGLHSNCQIVVTDLQGTESIPLSVTPFTVDTTLTSVSIASSNSTNTSYVRRGETVILSFSTQVDIQTPVVQILGRTAVVSGSGMVWQATTDILGHDPEGGIVSFVINYMDMSGNVGTPISTTNDSSTVVIDNIAPTLVMATIRSDNSDPSIAESGDILFLSFTTNELVTKPVVAFPDLIQTYNNPLAPGYSVQDVGTSWVTRTSVIAEDVNRLISFSITFSDLAGNVGVASTTTTDGSTVTIENPTPNSVADTSGSGKKGASYSGMKREDKLSSGKFWTKEESLVALRRENKGTSGKVLSYINKNGYVVFRGYQSGKMALSRFVKRMQNNIAFRGATRTNRRLSEKKLQTNDMLLADKQRSMKEQYQYDYEKKEEKTPVVGLGRLKNQSGMHSVLTRREYLAHKVNKFERIALKPLQQRVTRIRGKNMNTVKMRMGGKMLAIDSYLEGTRR